MKKISSFGWWSVLKTFIKYGAYIMIIIEGLQGIITAIEQKDSVKPDIQND